MHSELHIDFETYSPTDLKKSGVHRYVEDPYTNIWGFSYRFDNESVQRWKPGEPLPQEVVDHIAAGRWVVAHGAMFERTVWNRTIRGKHAPNAPIITPFQQSCTMARAQAVGLPADLDRLGVALNTTHQKDIEGAGLMKRMMRPKRWVNGAPIFEDDPVKIERLAQYCDEDVYTECDAATAVPWLDPLEQQVWALDQVINDRGIGIDLQLVIRANELVSYAKRQADYRMAMITNGHVPKCSNVAKLVEWLNSVGVPCQHLRKGDQDDIILLADILDNPLAIEAIELRRTAGKTSVAKYEKILECVCNDNSLYGLLFYHGARTGRWAGRLVQPQNYPRVDADSEAGFVEYVVELLLGPLPINEVYELIEVLGPPKSPIGEKLNGMASLAWLSKTLRSTFVARRGKKFIGGDFSNIEGRVTAWLSGEEWKIDAFIAYDLGIGDDLYKIAYANSFNVTVKEVTKPLRQIGKVQELALGFQGGIGAYYTMTHTYMVKLHMIVAAVKSAVSPQEWETQRMFFEGARDAAVYAKNLGRKEFSADEWTALKIVVNKWRAAHPMTVAGWKELQNASLAAVEQPGVIVPVYFGRVKYMSDGNYLYCQLPSGRIMSYAQPHIHRVEKYVIHDGRQWLDVDDLPGEVLDWLIKQGAKPRLSVQNTVFFWGISGETKQWVRIPLYGGYQCENIVQATARDVMRGAMLRAEAAGYTLVLTVHDELLAEVSKSFGSVEEFERIMATPEPWMQGLPIAAAGWEDVRYVK